MSSSAASISSAATCGVSDTGSQVVHTFDARRALSATSQSTEQVRPTANSSRSRYCWFSRRSSSSFSLVLQRDLQGEELTEEQFRDWLVQDERILYQLEPVKFYGTY